MLSSQNALQRPLRAIGLLLLGIVTLGCTLRIDGIGAGSGSITISTDSSTCIVTAGEESNDCIKEMPEDAEVTLTATAADGSVFTGWSGDCAQVASNLCTVMMDAAKTVTAAFDRIDLCPALSDCISEPNLGQIFTYSAIVLDASGNPVIAANINSRLVLIQCNDPRCAGNNESFSQVGLNAGPFPVMVLDAVGNPVISFGSPGNNFVSLVHCNDPKCAGTDEGIDDIPNMLDRLTRTTLPFSLALDANGFPFVTYDFPLEDTFKLIHCNDANCAGDNETIIVPDPAADRAGYMHLDSAGRPVLVYNVRLTGAVRVMHCGTPNCSVGNVTSTIQGVRGLVTDFALDSLGRPVIVLNDANSLVIVRCNDVNCAGGDESVSRPNIGDAFSGAKMRLNAAGHPVLVFSDGPNSALRVLACNDPVCAGNNDSLTAPDTLGNTGHSPRFVLHAQGGPVIAYAAMPVSTMMLRVLRCNDPECSPP